MKVLVLQLLTFASIANCDETDPSCKVLSGDAAWPSLQVWTTELPGVTPIEKEQSSDLTAHRRPDYQLIATKVEQVQSAIKFTAKYNIRLSIINSGVDFLGRSDAPSGLSLNVANFKGIRVAQSFTALDKGLPDVDYSTDSTKVNIIKPVAGKQAVVSFGAGMAGQELNNALHKSGLMIMAAATSQVKPAGGFAQSAGHGPLTNTFGLAADQVVEYKIVTADGKFRIANQVSNPDLFWALRGGGGGTFGVVIEATMKAFPTPKITQTKWWIKTKTPGDLKSIYAPTAYALSQLPKLSAEKGVQGYFFVYPNATYFHSIQVNQYSGIDFAKKTWEPLLEKMATYPGVQKPIQTYRDIPNFKSWFDMTFGPLEEIKDPVQKILFDDFPSYDQKRVGLGVAEIEEPYPVGILPMDSRLLGQQHLSSPKLEKALMESMPQMPYGMLRGHLTTGGAVSKMGKDTSVNPAWRNSWIHLIATGIGYPNATSLKNLAPELGSYSNECSNKETAFKRTMWGSNYERLLSIKTKYDPKDVFWVSPGIGADKFTADPKTGRVCLSKSDVNVATSAGKLPAYDNTNMAPGEEAQANYGPMSQSDADKMMAGWGVVVPKVASVPKAKSMPESAPNPKTTPSPKKSKGATRTRSSAKAQRTRTGRVGKSGKNAKTSQTGDAGLR